ncbi:hypothetical protein vBPpSSYP_125 [Pseudomonas phage vB_PpS_SYP]|nr:hypothetical protein vBPpSSYP_125 [Pseudomonas phage vB_PpS_SYP]
MKVIEKAIVKETLSLSKLKMGKVYRCLDGDMNGCIIMQSDEKGCIMILARNEDYAEGTYMHEHHIDMAKTTVFQEIDNIALLIE